MVNIKESLIKHNFTISNIIVHVIVIAVFIVTLFFTYGIYIEKKVFKKQIDIFVNDNLEEIKILLPDIADGIKNKVNDIEFQDLSKKDKIVADSNDKILKSATKVILGGIGVALVLVILIYIFFTPQENKVGLLSNPNSFVRMLLKYNIASVIFIGITEIIFLTVYGSDYQYIDNNKIKKGALVTLENVLSNIPTSNKSIFDMYANDVNIAINTINTAPNVANKIDNTLSNISNIDSNINSNINSNIDNNINNLQKNLQKDFQNDLIYNY
jgi:hypothetical protein